MISLGFNTFNWKKPPELAQWCDAQRHSTHSPHSQIRLVGNLYLEPMHCFGNLISAQKCLPYLWEGSLPCPALPCLEKIHNQGLFFIHVSVCIQSAVPLENIHTRKPGSPFRLLHLEASSVVIQGKHSKALTAGSLISVRHASERALAKWGKGHGYYTGIPDCTKHQRYSDVQWSGKSHYPIWIPFI